MNSYQNDNNLGNCPLHPKEKISLLCTKQNCNIPRLMCFKCIFFKHHPECMDYLILLEDLETKEFQNSLKNWIQNEEHRAFLNSFTKQCHKQKNADSFLQELTEFLDLSFKGLLQNISKKIFKTRKNLLELIREEFGSIYYEDHFSIDTLLKILKRNNKTSHEKEEINHALNNFFTADPSKLYQKMKGQSILSLEAVKEKVKEIIKNIEESYEKNSIDISKIKLNDDSQIEIYEVNRFKEWAKTNSWSYSGYVDCLTFDVDHNIVLEKVDIFTVEDNFTSGIFKVYEGGFAESQNTLYEKKFNFMNQSKEIIKPIIIENGLEIRRKQKYTLFLKIDKGRSIKGNSGQTTIIAKCRENRNVNFNFYISRFINCESNGTNCYSGQFPKLYFSLSNK